jgi:hypothetical protein
MIKSINIDDYLDDLIFTKTLPIMYNELQAPMTITYRILALTTEEFKNKFQKFKELDLYL